MEIWILSHGYDYGDVYDKYKWNDEARFLGAYYTKEEGLKALEKYKKIKGFCSHLDGFWLEKHLWINMLDGKVVMLLIIKKMR